MLQHKVYCLIVMSLGLSCSNASVKKGSLISRQIFDQSATSANQPQAPVPVTPESEGGTLPVPMPKEEKSADETVSPPGNISGSYLICVEMKAPTTTLPESTTNCAVRVQKTNNKLDLKTQFASVEWSYELAGGTSLSISQSTLASSPEWHVSIVLKAPTLQQVQAQRNALRIVVTTQTAAGVKLQEKTPISASFLKWLALDGGIVPTNAAVGGTESDGADNLYLCRIYNGNEIIPGKMIVHYNDPSKSICYTTNGSTVLISHSDDARTMLLRSDVLVMNQGTFDDYFEWLPATSGQKPAQALATGVDVNGRPLYTCRGLQAADSLVEQTPGVLRPGAIGCYHEYYGAIPTTSYQVLSWKDSATRIMMDSRAVLP